MTIKWDFFMTNAEQPQFQVPNSAEIEPEMGAREYLPTISSPDSLIESILERHEADLLGIPGVVMVSHRMIEPKREAIIVGVIDVGVIDRLPVELEEVPVRGEVIGLIDAF